MRKIKILCVTAMLVLFTALLAGCGANVTTVMDFDTTDGGFTGSRVMNLLIENEDLSNVTGGMPALEQVITENIPADLTYVVSYPSETQSQITFTLAFSSLDDYKTKVTNLLAANADNEIVAEIKFEKNETVFKKGLKFIENFQTVDLLRWYQNALSAAEIITESSSNWYELGSDTLIIDDVTLDTYGNRYDYDEVDERYLDDCEVHTVMNINGTYDRTITFKASEHSLEKLGEVNEDFSGYMKGIATDGIVFATETDEDGYYTTYTYTMTGLTAEELIAKTNAVMQTSDNTFVVTIAPKEGVVGTAVMTVEESFNASFYTDAEYNSVCSTVETYPNFKLTEGNAGTNYGNNEIYYYLHPGETLKQIGDWLVGYEKVELKLDAAKLDKMSVELVFTASETLAEEIRNIAFSALETACKDNAEFSKDGNVATCKFTGTAEEVSAKTDAFVKAYVPNGEEGAEQAFTDGYVKEMATASKFTNGLYGSLDLDLSPVLGNTKVYITGAGGTNIVTQLEKDETGAFCDTDIAVRFYAVNLNFVTLIVAAVFALLLIVGAVGTLLNRQGFAQWAAAAQEKKANKLAAQQAAMYYQQAPAEGGMNNQQPTDGNANYQQSAAPVQENVYCQQEPAAPQCYAPAQAEADEEEIY